MRFHAERALNGDRDADGDQLAIFPGDGSVRPRDDAIEIDPRFVIGGRETAHVLQALDVSRIVIVVAHRESL